MSFSSFLHVYLPRPNLQSAGGLLVSLLAPWAVLLSRMSGGPGTHPQWTSQKYAARDFLDAVYGSDTRA